MKTILGFFVASIALATLLLTNISTQFYSFENTGQATYVKKKIILSCSPDLKAINLEDSANIIPLLPGWGKYRMPVTVTNDSARIYFQQGINMYYGFHIIEALASFEKATKFDPDFAMGYWGKALAYGPNINDIGYAAAPLAFEAANKAKSLDTNCTSLEKELINAMLLRYSPDTTRSRTSLDQLYADAMKKAHISFPKSADAAALYADALMVQHPWDLYDRSSDPKPWTPEIVKVLEGLIKEFPDNPGANHYYIHAIEGSRHPELGIKVADRLGEMMPGVSHLVHMPSHIYIRSGQYKKGIDANEKAIKGYNDYVEKYPLAENGAFLYLMHNQHMQAACAMMDGQYKNAMEFAKATSSSITGFLDAGGYYGVYGQYLFMSPHFTNIRFGKWDEILNADSISDTYVYANIMWRFSRGLAYARKHQPEQASIELHKIQQNKTHPQLKESPPAFNPGLPAVELAEKILEALIAEEKNQLPRSIDLLKEAVDKENEMLYNEPKDWILPARQYLGNTLLKFKQYAEAEKVYKEDLIVNPENAWSLTGLKLALTAQKKTKDLASLNQRLKKALERTDVRLFSSVF